MKLFDVIRDFAAIPFFVIGMVFVWLGGLIVSPGTGTAWDKAIEYWEEA